MKFANFRDRRVLVTGHTGFKGSWLSLWLDRLGAKVSGLSLSPDTEPNLFSLTQVKDCLENHILADIREASAVSAALEECNPEVVFHLAAQPLVRRSYQQPLLTMETNFNGTLHLLESLRLRNRSCAVVMVTTDKVYRNEERPSGYVETDALGGADPYSARKAAAEVLIESYRQSYFSDSGLVRMASARGGNVIGGGDWAPDRVVTDLLKALKEERALELRNPKAVRPWQHVLDLLSGYLTLGSRLLGDETGVYCDAWNFGPVEGDDVCVSELVDAFIQVWGAGEWLDGSSAGSFHETKILKLCVSKSLGNLGWKPLWEAREAIARTARWYEAQSKGQDMREYCLREISEFESQMVALA